jgi:hypothetical protein
MGWEDWVGVMLPVALLLRAGYRAGLTRHGLTRHPARREHQPDYARIRQLERELGIGQDDEPRPPRGLIPPEVQQAQMRAEGKRLMELYRPPGDR